MRTVLIILFDGVQSLDVTGPLEVFSGANRWRSRRDPNPVYRIRTASLDGRPVRTPSGLRVVPDGDLGDEADPDVLLVPGGEGARHANPDLVAWLATRGRHAGGDAPRLHPCARGQPG